MASEGSERKSGSEIALEGQWLGWAAWHPKEGFAESMGWDGGGKLYVYDDLDRELLDDLKRLNEDDPDKRWIAIKIKVVAEKWDRKSPYERD